MDQSLLACLAELADQADSQREWPRESLEIARQLGAFTASMPPHFGGQALPMAEKLARAEQLASVCLTTAFILSQREGAVRRLLTAPNRKLAKRYAPRLASGECFMTVGLSQLTTSQQRGRTALVVEEYSSGFRLNGDIPWVTGADQADAIVIAGRLADGRQAMFLLPNDTPRMTIRPPMNLAALQGSRTSSIQLDQIELGPEWLLNGPAEQLAGGAAAGGLETSALALGHAAGAIDDLKADAEQRPGLVPVAEEFAASHSAARDRLHGMTFIQSNPDDLVAVRVECTRLALRATQAALTAAKGSGFVVPHPAQRRAKQALFFLVWSCPRPAAEGLLAELAE